MMIFKVTLGLLLCVALTVEGKVPGRKLAGGWQKADKNSSMVLNAAKSATLYLESARNSAKAYRLVEVINAKQQVVAGMNYNLTLKIGQTDCHRNDRTNLESCALTKTQKCRVTVWSRAWLNATEVTAWSCDKEKNVKKPKVTKPPLMPGGESEVDVSNEDVKQATTFATTEITSRSNGRFTVQHQRIIKATSQVVAGAMYRITVQVSVTDNQTRKAKPTRCTIKVWDQAWRTPRYTLEEYKCDKYLS